MNIYDLGQSLPIKTSVYDERGREKVATHFILPRCFFIGPVSPQLLDESLGCRAFSRVGIKMISLRSRTERCQYEAQIKPFLGRRNWKLAWNEEIVEGKLWMFYGLWMASKESEGFFG